MLLYDTLLAKKKELRVPKTKTIRLFVCGPTVYNFSHIGHARTYVAFDMIVKYMRKQGYKIYYLQNITDIDDKIINKANEEKVKAEEIAIRFENEYLDDMKKLGISSVDKYARASDYIKEIIQQIKLLEEKGYAYQISSGVYFKVQKFKDYGKLSRQNLKKMKEAVSIEKDPEKQDFHDFSLWKASKPEEPSWDSPWGRGRPGWHIEDTAITYKEFGKAQYELHGGARDLIFPHHEAEIAQMETAYGKKPMVKYWVHTGFLQIGGEKMARSLKNFITIRDVLEKYSPQTLRIFFTTRHYRSSIDYDIKGLDESKTNEDKITEFWKNIPEIALSNKNTDIDTGIKELIENFWKHLENDFNTPQAMALLFKLITYVNKREELCQNDKKYILSFLEEINSIFHIVNTDNIQQKSVPAKIIALSEERNKLRKARKWEDADTIRKKIENLGYSIKDTESGSKVKKINL